VDSFSAAYERFMDALVEYYRRERRKTPREVYVPIGETIVRQGKPWERS